MANQKTAVEWLVEQLENQNGTYRGFGNIAITHQQLIQQAKEMEKQQRISDYYQGACDESDNHGAQYICESNAEKWYNDKFKK